MKKRGLQLSDEKTIITHIKERNNELKQNPYLDRKYYQAYKIRQQAKREKAYKNLAVYELGYNDL